MIKLLSMLALPIFPCSRPQSIVGASELNFCVRDGNRWTLTAINTNCYQVSLKTTLLYYSFFICQVVFFISAHHKQHNEVVASGNDEQSHPPSLTASNPTKWLRAEAMSSGMSKLSALAGSERYAACEELVTRTGFEPMLTA